MNKNIYITISGGVVQAVNTDLLVEDVIIIDLDTDDQETQDYNQVLEEQAARVTEVY